ncbi:MAG TPA: HAD-IA family hydrolase, partial [Tepidiformaceae bacterium]|nr:HAD-IA family hydrolase [Tepidiformaceae bacterium]
AGRMTALAHAHEAMLGTKIDPLELWRSHRGGSLEAMGRRLVGDEWATFTRVYRERYYTLVRDIRPYEGIETVLRYFHGAEIPMGVVTSKISYGAIEELTTAGLLGFFHTVVGADDTDNHKPDPEPVFAALDRMMVDHIEHVLFVGDSPADIWAARNAGVKSVAALWGTVDSEALLEALPDYTAKSPGEVLSIAAEIGGRG